MPINVRYHVTLHQTATQSEIDTVYAGISSIVAQHGIVFLDHMDSVSFVHYIYFSER